jgi:modification methylase
MAAPKGKLRQDCRAYAHIPPEDLRPHPVNLFPKANIIYHGDARNMSVLPDSCVHLVVTSPPYNAGKSYEEDLPLDNYLAMLSAVWTECFRILIHGGRIAVNCPVSVGRTIPVPLSMYICQTLLNAGFRYRCMFIWSKGVSTSKGTAWGSWMSASNPYNFDTSELIYVFSKGRLSRAEKGLSTISREDFLICTDGTWNISTKGSKKHPAPFPVELPRRLIEFYTYKDEIVLDPFMGSGTTAVAAIKTGRRFVGFDTDAGYVDIARRRVAIEMSGFGL